MQFLVDSPSHPPSSPRHHPYHHHSHFNTSNTAPSPSHSHSHLSSPAPAPPTPQPHHIPFPQPPGSQPGSLGFGFGLSAASNLNSTVSWGLGAATGGTSTRSSPGPSSFAHQQQPSSPLSAVGAGRRRRRSLSPGEEDEAMEEREQVRAVRGLKKARTTGAEDGLQASNRLLLAGKNEQDLGKALANLSKPSLLTLLHSLLTAQPSLKPLITSLLPPPTLRSTLTSLQTLERSVLAALPSGAQLREEYIWGRVRVPLEEYVAEAKIWLSAFINPTTPPGVGAGGGEDDLHHPSTTFAFLHELTSSLRRLEVALPPSRPNSPNALTSHLLPLTLNSWHIFLTRLSTSVNQEGRIISAGMLRGWFERLEELCVASPGVGAGVGVGERAEGPARKQCEGVRERMRKEVGWLVGLRGSGRESAQGMMEEEEEEEL
ncbi:hypothetical protein BCR35DRAFT_310506 [Leucosporidium creatinivorum]|uniref:Tethering factor for nuclear proteasome STS1 n=1 Tax=Leucosporidium creatinivorum TaxID=106004 RepID=A0A1Y2D3Y0_9BASI|nr:hypothetical protein BCR35DRAFT_310506 [Leucosporidium creatinivorum]